MMPTEKPLNDFKAHRDTPTLGRRYLFLSLDANTPSGGRNFLYKSVEVLRELGYDARILHTRPGFTYTWFVSDVPVEYKWPENPRTTTGLHGIRSHIRETLGRRRAARRHIADGGGPPVAFVSSDVLMVPETQLSRREQFPGIQYMIFNQNGFYFADAIARLGEVPHGFLGVVSTSVLSDAAAASFGFICRQRVQYSIDANLFSFKAHKKRQIAYMPRKRGDEAQRIVELLQIRGRLGDFTFKAIDGMTREDAATVLKESLIFISLSEREGFGLPPAEAMAAGCVVVGYTGHGGREFFTADTGICVEDGDILGVIDGVEATIADHFEAPEAQTMRRKAVSDLILSRYSEASMREAFRTAWIEVERWVSMN